MFVKIKVSTSVVLAFCYAVINAFNFLSSVGAECVVLCTTDIMHGSFSFGCKMLKCTSLCGKS